jgi:nucleoside-diphosphate-sugar epimerase
MSLTMRGERVLVTGADGFVGRPLVARLCAAGAEVHCVSRRPARPHGGPAAQRHALDLFDAPARARLIWQLRPTLLVHLAWTTGHGHYWQDPANLGWVDATIGLLGDFACAGGRAAFMAGSCAEYDWHDTPPLEAGRTRLRAATLYGRCKAETSHRALALAQQRGLRLAWGRIAFPFGPGEPAGRLVPSLVRALRAGEPARFGPLEVARDFVPVGDLADMIVHVLQADFHGALDLASGRLLEVGEIARTLAQAAGRPDLLRPGALPPRAHEPLRLPIQPRALRELGWRHECDIEGALRASFEHAAVARAASEVMSP